MIELDEHEGSYLAICKHYRAVYETPEIKDDKDKMREVNFFKCILKGMKTGCELFISR